MSGDLISAPWFARPGWGDAPVGAVIAFAGQLGPPDPPGPPQASPPIGTTSPIEAWGWMACDGRMLAIAEYPELFAALGSLYGGSPGSDGQDGTFAIPDYRGYFLRGIDDGRNIDKDSRTAAPGQGAEATGIGSTQLSALLSHKHDIPKYSPSVVAQQGTDSGVPTTQVDTSGIPVDDSGNSLGALVSPNETRPINIYVNYIIKFTGGLRPTWSEAPGRGE